LCRLSVDNIRFGTVPKAAYAERAKAISGGSADGVAAAVRSLSRVLMEAAKHDLSAGDFALSVADFKWSPPTTAKVAESFAAHVKDIRSYLSDVSLPLPDAFHDVDWRLDMQLASRCLRAQAKPIFLLQLQTTDPNAPLPSGAPPTAAPTAGGKDVKSADVKSAAGSSAIAGGAADTVVAASKENVRTQFLSADYANIKHLCTELEKAIGTTRRDDARLPMGWYGMV
jgi:hypothetical protein